jgi:hypothetical protein
MTPQRSWLQSASSPVNIETVSGRVRVDGRDSTPQIDHLPPLSCLASLTFSLPPTNESLQTFLDGDLCFKIE